MSGSSAALQAGQIWLRQRADAKHCHALPCIEVMQRKKLGGVTHAISLLMFGRRRCGVQLADFRSMCKGHERDL